MRMSSGITKFPSFPLMEIFFLAVVVTHSLLGLRSILLDFNPRPTHPPRAGLRSASGGFRGDRLRRLAGDRPGKPLNQLFIYS